MSIYHNFQKYIQNNHKIQTHICTALIEVNLGFQLKNNNNYVVHQLIDEIKSQ